MKISLLRNLLLLDAVVLAMMGVLFIFAPQRIAAFFHFTDLPASMVYLIGLWGCVMLSLAAAYAIVSRDPIRHRLEHEGVPLAVPVHTKIVRIGDDVVLVPKCQAVVLVAQPHPFGEQDGG